MRFALRSLLKTPGFTAVAVATLAIAIGACTALFSVLQAVVLRPLPYPDPDTLVSIWALQPERTLQAPAVSWEKYLAFRERRDVFRELSLTAGNAFTLTDTVVTLGTETVTSVAAEIDTLTVDGLAGGDNFTVSALTRTATITGSVADTVTAVNDVLAIGLSDSTLTRTGLGAVTITGIETANLTGGVGVNAFTVSSWTGTANLAGLPGND